MRPMPWRDWIRTVEVEPSIYAADFSRLGEQVRQLLEGGVRVFHFDVGDGHFVPPITMGPIVLKWIAPIVHAAGGVVDCHLMVERPHEHIEQFAHAGAGSVTVQYEVTGGRLAEVAALARRQGLAIGLAFNPETRPGEAAEAAALAGVDIVLCLSIHPGWSGQEFMPEALERIAELRRLLPSGIPIQVDGGINHENIAAVRNAGASLFVSGASIFDHEDIVGSYRRLLGALG
jgi:ribulose-phosphate 3-epimerase